MEGGRSVYSTLNRYVHVKVTETEMNNLHDVFRVRKLVAKMS